jgi:hypothetical protein
MDYSKAGLGEHLDKMDARVTEILAENLWPWKHPSNWLKQYGVQRVMQAHAKNRCLYYQVSSGEWMREQHEMTVRNVTLAQLWQHWGDVRAACKESRKFGYVAVDGLTTIDVELKPGISTRQQIDAMVAADRAKGFYDLMSRVYEGRRPRTWEETRQWIKVKKPKRTLPPQRVKKVPTKYVRGPNGIKIPRSK